MAKIWARRLEAGTQIFSDCPEKYRDDVIAILQRDVTLGIITQEDYDRIINT